MNSDNGMKVGVIGLGLMGAALSRRLLSQKHEVHVYDRMPSKTSQFVGGGATAHQTPRDLGMSVEVAFTLVTDQQAVDSVTLGESGLFEGMKAGSLWVEMSTIDPDASKRQAEECHRRGIERLDAPVAGGPKWIEEGRVMLLVGGSREVFEKRLPLLNQIAASVLYLGEDGNGHKMKLLLNLYLGMVSVAFCEVLTLSRKIGFDPQLFMETVNKSVHKSYFTEVRAPPILKGDFKPAFSLKNLLKDLLLAQDQAKRHGAVLPASTATTELFGIAANLGQAEMDYTSIALTLAKLNGL